MTHYILQPVLQMSQVSFIFSTLVGGFFTQLIVWMSWTLTEWWGERYKMTSKGGKKRYIWAVEPIYTSKMWNIHNYNLWVSSFMPAKVYWFWQCVWWKVVCGYNGLHSIWISDHRIQPQPISTQSFPPTPPGCMSLLPSIGYRTNWYPLWKYWWSCKHRTQAHSLADWDQNMAIYPSSLPGNFSDSNHQ